MSFSQNSEDLFILEYFQEKAIGKFIDIGAYHYEKFSNTRALYLDGWSGVLVEPSPQNYRAIADHYAGDPRITVLNVAIGEVSGEVDFWESNGDAVSSTDPAHVDRWANSGVKFQRVKVEQVSVNAFMEQYCKGVDFISIDTESTNMVIFKNIPDFVFDQIKMLVIEHDGNQAEIEDKLSAFGFSTLHVNGENIISAKL